MRTCMARGCRSPAAEARSFARGPRATKPGARRAWSPPSARGAAEQRLRVRERHVARRAHPARAGDVLSLLAGGAAQVDVVARRDGRRLARLLLLHLVAVDAGALLPRDGEEV